MFRLGEKHLFADDGDFGGWNFEAHEAVIRIEQEQDFEVGSGDLEGFEGFSVRIGGAGGFDGDGTGRQLLRDEDGERLRAALRPVVDAGKDGVLMVEVVVEDGDERGVEGQVLFKGARALDCETDFGHAIGKENVGAIGFFRLGSPIVTDGRAVGLQRERAGDFANGTFGRLDFRSALGEPSASGGRNFKFLVADSLAIELDGQLAFVLNEDAGGSVFLLRGKGQRGAKCDRNHREGCSSEFHGGNNPP